MKVLLVIDSLGLGGTEMMLVRLVRSLQPFEVDVTVADLGNAAESTLIEAIEASGACTRSFPFPHLFRPATLVKLVRFARHERFDLIQTFLTYANIVGSLAGRASNTPVIGSLRNTGADPRDYSWARQFANTLALRYLCTVVLANGQAVAAYGRARLPHARIEVIPNAVELVPDLSEDERRSLRTQITGDNDRPLILSVGRLDSRKGFPDLLQAFAQVHASCPEAALVLAGGGYLRPELEALLRELHLDGHAFLLGMRDDVDRLLAAADIYVNSSHSEGMAVSILEAMAAGLPVIATAVGDTPNILPSGLGILVPAHQPERLAEAIKRLLAAPAERHALGQAARRHIQEHYGLTAWTGKMLELYHRFARGAPAYSRNPSGS